MAKKKIRVEQSFYDTDRFYSILSALGKKDATDKEIAAALNIAPETFSRMKNGKYEGWTDKQNVERSERICQVLTRARASLITALKDSYIKLATGNAKSTTTRFVQARCMCNGSDRECPACGGTGYIALTDRAIVMEQQLPPNAQAITTLLRHYSPEWRKGEEECDNDLGFTPTNGIPISKWIELEMTQGNKENLEKMNDEAQIELLLEYNDGHLPRRHDYSRISKEVKEKYKDKFLEIDAYETD